jgi:cell division protease FtsH
MNGTVKTIVFWLVIGISALLLWEVVRSTQPGGNAPEISYSQFMAETGAGNIASVSITGDKIQGVYREGKGSFRLIGPSNAGVYVGALRDKGVEIWFRDAPSQSAPLQLLGTWAPLLLLAALWFFMIRQMQRKRATNADSGLGDPREFR